MIEKILLAIDDSVHSERVVVVAAELASKLGGEVIVLHIREWTFGPRGPFDEGLAESQKLVDKVATRLEDMGIKARGLVEGSYVGHTPRLIVDTATKEGAGLICVGSHGVSNLAGILLRSVAHKVLQLANLPVLVVR